MRTQNSAHRLTAELTGLHVRYKNALRTVLPTGVTGLVKVADFGPSVVACIRRTLTAQTELARATIVDVERLATRLRSARTVYERLRRMFASKPPETLSRAANKGRAYLDRGPVRHLYSARLWRP